MKTITINGGFCSEYDDMSLWVKDFNVGAEAAYITKNENGTTTIKNGVVSKVTSLYRDNDNDKDKYDEACNEILNCDCSVSGEFITDDDSFYVAINTIDSIDGTTETTVEYHDAYFC